MEFTLVSTVFNEQSRLSKTIADLNAQTVQPSEIVITDAGSTDATYEILRDWAQASTLRITILRQKGCNVAEGRNLAIRTAKFDTIVSTDFGCRFHKDWLKSIIEPFQDPSVKIVGGAYTVNEVEQQTLAAKAAYIMSDGYNVDVHAAGFIPSSRSIAYKREVFNSIGGYCEWLTLAADDLVFGKEVIARGFKPYMSNKPYVYWGRHKTAKGYIKEAGRYGLGDGEARVNLGNFLKNFLGIILRCLFFVDLIVILIAKLSAKSTSPVLVGLILFLPGFRPYFSYTKNWLNFRSSKYNLKVYLFGLYLLEATRISYIKHYISGILHATKKQKEQARSLRERLFTKNKV